MNTSCFSVSPLDVARPARVASVSVHPPLLQQRAADWRATPGSAEETNHLLAPSTIHVSVRADNSARGLVLAPEFPPTVVRAALPLGFSEQAMGYFEFRVEMCASSELSIGLLGDETLSQPLVTLSALGELKPHSMWEMNSPPETLARWSSGDIVGLGLVRGSDEGWLLFATRNGHLEHSWRMGRAPSASMVPFCSLADAADVVHFIATEFAFDTELFARRHLAVSRKRKLVPPAVARNFVKAFLTRRGYFDTLRAMGEAPKAAHEHGFKHIRHLVLSAQVDEAMCESARLFGSELVASPAGLALRVQGFVELVRQGKVLEAVRFAREHFANELECTAVSEAMLLLVPASSACPRHLLLEERRLLVAEQLAAHLASSSMGA